MMDGDQVVIINLARGRVGEDSASLLGALLVTSIGLAACSRANVPERERFLFFLYIDEFQTFTTLAVADLLSELRKYGLALVVSHQYLHQLEEDVQHAVLGNAGTLIAFRLGAKPAPLLAREFMGVVEPAHLVYLRKYEACVRLMVEGEPSRAFKGRVFPLARARPRLPRCRLVEQQSATAASENEAQ